jgi:glucosamine-6-phosphate deaminase
MRVLWAKTEDAFVAAAMAAVLPSWGGVVALAAGASPRGLYRGMAGMGLPPAFYVNLDEYLGLGAGHPASFAFELTRGFLAPAGVLAGRVRLLRGDAEPAAEAAEFDAAVAARGGVRLAILGLGANGHVAFNEPGADWEAGTHVTRLSEATRAANAGAMPAGEAVPEFGITMGLGTLRAASQVVLLVKGAAKRAALAALLAGRADVDWPVTAFCAHPGLVVVAEAGLKSVEHLAGDGEGDGVGEAEMQRDGDVEG